LPHKIKDAGGLGVDVKVILTPPFILCMAGYTTGWCQNGVHVQGYGGLLLREGFREPAARGQPDEKPGRRERDLPGPETAVFGG
jgi:hypothetical protein